jgi:SEC-C motif-containing protein
VNEQDPCPCGRDVAYAECCGPLHAGAAAPTAERLMRSRYSAFALGDAGYLLATWDPATRPAELELDPGVEWRRLFIHGASAGGPFDRRGSVDFTAIARTSEGRLEQSERSEFRRSAEGRWLYVDGEGV